MKKMILMMILLASLPASANHVSESLAERGISHERLEVFETDGVVTGYMGVMRGSNCVDEGESTACADESLEKAVDAAWGAYGVALEQRTELRVVDDLVIDENFRLRRLRQTVNGVDVYGGEIILVVNADSDIEIVNGSLLPWQANNKPQAQQGLATALSVIEGSLGNQGLSADTVVPFSTDRGPRLALTNNANVEQQVNPTTGKPVWIYRGAESQTGIFIVDDGDIIEEGGEEYPSNKPAYIPVREATDPYSWAPSVKSSDWEYVGYDYNIFTGQCQYQARYDTSVSSQKVDRIDDHTYTRAYKDGSCSVAPTVHTGTSFAHSDYKEWDLMWRLKQHQSYMTLYVLPKVAGGNLGSIGGVVGAGVDACGSNQACYSTPLSTVFFEGTQGDNSNPGVYDVSLIGHEYGHHVHHSWGFDDYIGCTNTNHRTLIMQWLASVVGNVIAVDAHKGVEHHYMLGAWTIGYHWEGNNQANPANYAVANSNCIQGSVDLQQPMWEIMHDVNCLEDFCDGFWDYQDYNTLGHSEGYLGQSIARGVAYVALIAPSVGVNYTIQNAGGNMRVYLYSRLNSQGDAQVTKIMGHHGL